MGNPLNIGLLLYPGLTQLDLTGPYEVFARTPNARVHLIWKNLNPIQADSGLTLVPTVTFENSPKLDVICVPGGPGQMELMEDEETLAFLRRIAAEAQYVTSVCVGSLILAAAGLLQGYRATSYWMVVDALAPLGATPVKHERIVIDRNRITGGGVTAGIDFALVVVGQLLGDEVAQEIQLAIEYNPQPPFNAGSPQSAPKKIVDRVIQRAQERIARRLSQAHRIGHKGINNED